MLKYCGTLVSQPENLSMNELISRLQNLKLLVLFPKLVVPAETPHSNQNNNKLTKMHIFGNFLSIGLALHKDLPHSARTWILNPNCALMRARVGYKIRFDQPTYPPIHQPPTQSPGSSTCSRTLCSVPTLI